jgi:hypothetical protein
MRMDFDPLVSLIGGILLAGKFAVIQVYECPCSLFFILDTILLQGFLLLLSFILR